MKKKKHTPIKLKDRDGRDAKWEVCIEGPTMLTDLGTLCGKTAWGCDHEQEECPPDTKPTCPNCIAFVKWMNERKL